MAKKKAAPHKSVTLALGRVGDTTRKFMISDWSHQWVLFSGGPPDMLEQQLEGSLGAWAMPHDGFRYVD